MVQQKIEQGIFSRQFFPQWIAAAGVILVMAQLGAMCGWTSPYLAKLSRPDAEPHLDPGEASWVASLINVGRFLGAFLGSGCTHLWGSKHALLHTLVPMALGWALILCAKDALMLYLARVSLGLGMGMAFCCFPLYIGEIAVPRIRGAIVTVAFCGSPFGNVLASVIGAYTSMIVSSCVFLVPCLMAIALFWWLPDSPHHLVKRGDLEGARQAIDWYRNGVGVDEELKAVQAFVQSGDGAASAFKNFLGQLSQPYIRKAICMSMMLFMYMQLSGLNSVLFYMENILREGQVTIIEPALTVILVSVVGAITALASINLMDKCGRRVLIMTSGCIITVSMLILGASFVLLDHDYDPAYIQSFVVFSLFLFMIGFVAGLMPVPSAVLSELFPDNVKCAAACLACLTGALFAFGASKAYQPLVSLIGEGYVFFIHALLMSTVVPFVLLYMPETKGKSLQEIQDILSKKS
ncbi:hypothetical protein TKK_0002825 [Trichogramma kaykai]|uniref:Major facilitator superfamily (MFS) profile domain-containing protein n=1 Tax=Trichogramma kaykai TaxID=54128 RepID=A0ABD2XRA5_9HYME